MARKRGRRVSKRPTHSRVSRSKSSSRRSRRVPGRVASSRGARQNNIKIVFNNLVLFVILFLISLIFYQVFLGGIIPDSSGVFVNLFGIFMIAFGFISVAFLITLIVFWLLKLFKK